MVNLVKDRFPTRNRSDSLPIPGDLIKEELPSGDFHIQEERRLFYVGMTRAKERLFLTAADFYGDGKRKKKISPFVFEALGDKFEYKVSNTKQISNFKLKNQIETKKRKQITNNKSLVVNRLSVSQIETFKICPLHYKLKYIYNFPVSPTASASFGNSIHQTLKEYLETKKDILGIYRKNWIEECYFNKAHKEEFYKKG